jgi:hypothetical protein
MTRPEDTAGSLRWTAYLDALEALIEQCGRELQAGRIPEPVSPAMPSEPPPAGTQQRRERLSAALDELTERMTALRDAVAAELHALPHRPPTTGMVGTHLDILG